MKNKLIHRDIKTGNVLIDDDLNARICDPGLAREQDSSFSQTEKVGSWGYTDPVYNDTGEFTTASDVFSFGVVLLEVRNKRASCENESEGERSFFSCVDFWRSCKNLETVPKWRFVLCCVSHEGKGRAYRSTCAMIEWREAPFYCGKAAPLLVDR